MDDTISRLAVIQIIEKMRARIGHNLERSVGRAMIEILDEVGEDVGKLPSALGTNLAEVGTDLISRQAAIEAVQNRHMMLSKEKVLLINDLEKLPSTQPYTIQSDGRLWATVDDIDKVTAVVVDEYKSKFCKQFYEDYEDAQPDIIRCKDCKHWIPYDWMFSEVWQSKNIADYPEDEIGCDCCDMAMKANDFCSRGERREDG